MHSRFQLPNRPARCKQPRSLSNMNQKTKRSKHASMATNCTSNTAWKPFLCYRLTTQIFFHWVHVVKHLCAELQAQLFEQVLSAEKSLLQEKYDSKHSAGWFVHMLMQSCEFYMNCITRTDPNRELLFTLHLGSYFLAGTISWRVWEWKKWQTCVYNASTAMPSRLPAQASAIFGVLTCLAQVNFMVFNDYIFNDYLRLCAGAVSVKQIDIVTKLIHRLAKHSNKIRYKTLRLCRNGAISISALSIKQTTSICEAIFQRTVGFSSYRDFVSPCSHNTIKFNFNVFLRLIAHRRSVCLCSVGIDVKK